MELKQSVGDKDEDECQVVVQEIEKLPSDAIYEILIRVNLGNLLRQCQWVCKDWHKLIVCDQKFQQIHSQRTTASGYIIECVDRQNCCTFRFIPNIDDQNQQNAPQIASPSLDFLPTTEYIHIGCSSQYGSLICCIGKAINSGRRRVPTCRIPVYYVCEPATREWRICLTSYNQVFVYHVDQDKWAVIKITEEMKKLTEEHSSFAVDCNGELGILYSTKKSMEIWTLENYSTTDPIWKRKYYNDASKW